MSSGHVGLSRTYHPSQAGAIWARQEAASGFTRRGLPLSGGAPELSTRGAPAPQALWNLIPTYASGLPPDPHGPPADGPRHPVPLHPYFTYAHTRLGPPPRAARPPRHPGPRRRRFAARRRSPAAMWDWYASWSATSQHPAFVMARRCFTRDLRVRILLFRIFLRSAGFTAAGSVASMAASRARSVSRRARSFPCRRVTGAGETCLAMARFQLASRALGMTVLSRLLACSAAAAVDRATSARAAPLPSPRFLHTA